MKPYEAYLTCEVKPGMFPKERAVVVYDEYGNPAASGFFPESHIKDGKLEVIVLEERRDGVLDFVLIEPIGAHSGQGFLGSIRNVWVPKADISVPTLTHAQNR